MEGGGPGQGGHSEEEKQKPLTRSFLPPMTTTSSDEDDEAEGGHGRGRGGIGYELDEVVIDIDGGHGQGPVAVAVSEDQMLLVGGGDEDDDDDEGVEGSTTEGTGTEEEETIIESEEMQNEIIMSFPLNELARLDEMISNPRWVVPVLPNGQLEVLLDATIELCKKGLDVRCQPCHRFIRDGLTISFTKILTDDAVSSWKPDIHKCILKCSEKLIDLIVIKLKRWTFIIENQFKLIKKKRLVENENTTAAEIPDINVIVSLLELLSILFNPNNKFHSFNSCRQPEFNMNLLKRKKIVKNNSSKMNDAFIEEQKQNVNELDELDSREIIGHIQQGIQPVIENDPDDGRNEDDLTLTADSFYSYAQTNDLRACKGWLTDLINRFGSQGGFGLVRDILKNILGRSLRNNFTSPNNEIVIQLIFSLLKPFGYSADYLTHWAIERYFKGVSEDSMYENQQQEQLLPNSFSILNYLPEFIEVGILSENVNNDGRGKSANSNNSRTSLKSFDDITAGKISSIIKYLKSLQIRLLVIATAANNCGILNNSLYEPLPADNNTVIDDYSLNLKNLEFLRLRLILRMLQVSSFNGKMQALNEINTVIQNVMNNSNNSSSSLNSTSYYPLNSRINNNNLDNDSIIIEFLNTKKLASWLMDNSILQIILKDSLHQPQYVEKIEKILRFIIKERVLTYKDLDDVWAAQEGKHDTIVKNVHDLLAKLAWDFSPDQKGTEKKKEKEKEVLCIDISDDNSMPPPQSPMSTYSIASPSTCTSVGLVSNSDSSGDEGGPAKRKRRLSGVRLTYDDGTFEKIESSFASPVVDNLFKMIEDGIESASDIDSSFDGSIDESGTEDNDESGGAEDTDEVKDPKAWCKTSLLRFAKAKPARMTDFKRAVFDLYKDYLKTQKKKDDDWSLFEKFVRTRNCQVEESGKTWIIEFSGGKLRKRNLEKHQTQFLCFENWCLNSCDVKSFYRCAQHSTGIAELAIGMIHLTNGNINFGFGKIFTTTTESNEDKKLKFRKYSLHISTKDIKRIEHFESAADLESQSKRYSELMLDHLFESFQLSWTKMVKMEQGCKRSSFLVIGRQREKLLELIRRLAEDDKDGVMAFKVLTLFWNLASNNSPEVSPDIMDQALRALVKVLDYSCSQMRDNQKYQWLNKCMDQINENDIAWVIPAIRLMKDIFTLYPEGNHHNTHLMKSSQYQNTNNQSMMVIYRPNIISKMQKERGLIVRVCQSINSYMNQARNYIREERGMNSNNNCNTIDASEIKLDGRYSHVDQIRERLNFLRFLLRDGQMYLCEEQANLIWSCLAETPIFPNIDREICFEWFSKLLHNLEDTDLEPKILDQFFATKILKFDATQLTDTGMECFEKFFKALNVHNKRLVLNVFNNGSYNNYIKRENDVYLVMNDAELIGIDYIWRIILYGTEDIANRAIGFLRQMTATTLGPNIIHNQMDIYEDFISSCLDRLKASSDTIQVILSDKDSLNRVRQEVTKMCRVLRTLNEYILECDSEYFFYYFNTNIQDKVEVPVVPVAIDGEDENIRRLKLKKFSLFSKNNNLPLYRASVGKNLSIYIKFSPFTSIYNFNQINQEVLLKKHEETGRIMLEENNNNLIITIEIITHYNETPSGLKKQMINQIQHDIYDISTDNSNSTNLIKLDLYYNGESIDLSEEDDRRTIAQFGFRDKMLLLGKISYQGNANNVTNSPDSSEESSSNGNNPILPSILIGSSAPVSTTTTSASGQILLLRRRNRQQQSSQQQKNKGGKSLRDTNFLKSSEDGNEESNDGDTQSENNMAEICLPSVLLAMNEKRMEFLIQLCSLIGGCATLGEEEDRLRDAARNLLSNIPTCHYTQSILRSIFFQQQQQQQPSQNLNSEHYKFLFSTEPATVLYRLEVFNVILNPSFTIISMNNMGCLKTNNRNRSINFRRALLDTSLPLEDSEADIENLLKEFLNLEKLNCNDDESLQIQIELVKKFFLSNTTAVSASAIIEMLTKNNFIPLADSVVKRQAYHLLLKLTKMILTVMLHLLIRYANTDEKASNYFNSDRINILTRNGLKSIPNPSNEIVLRKISEHLSIHLYNLLKEGNEQQYEGLKSLMNSGLEGNLPDMGTIRFLIRLAISTSSGSLNYFFNNFSNNSSNNSSNNTSEQNQSKFHQANREPIEDEILLCEEILQVLTLSFLLNPNALEQLVYNSNSMDESSQSLTTSLWKSFICQMLYLTPSKPIRFYAREQLYLIATMTFKEFDNSILYQLIHFLYNEIISDELNQFSTEQQSREVFLLLAQLVKFYCKKTNGQFESEEIAMYFEQILNNEIKWLRETKREFNKLHNLYEDPTCLPSEKNKSSTNEELNPEDDDQEKRLLRVSDEDLLEGHINLVKELSSFLNSEKKALLGTCLIKEILEDFVFPWSKAHSLMSSSSSVGTGSDLQKSNNVKIMKIQQFCSSQMTQNAVLELVVNLCNGCLPNLKSTVDIVCTLFDFYNYNKYNVIDEDECDRGDGFENNSIQNSSRSKSSSRLHQTPFNISVMLGSNDWEFLPPVGNRPVNGYVGLKNAGATCYMNSVLQQLFMIDEIKKGILSNDYKKDEMKKKTRKMRKDGIIKKGSGSSEDADDDDEDTTTDLSKKKLIFQPTKINEQWPANPTCEDLEANDRKNYNLTILKQIQMIYGHLELSRLQYYVPAGLWKHFRLQGEPVNLREQQDAVEFFMSIVESIDEGLKVLNEEQILSKTLGGLFSDQKICKDCPHRYAKEEPFSLISVDIRNHSNLLDSLEQYVKGELLEGADAYHCERCNTKVTALKRLCVKKLPPILAIQLKRFEYDYERLCPIKFNDYFEFPRELDMEPYTAQGLADMEQIMTGNNSEKCEDSNKGDFGFTEDEEDLLNEDENNPNSKKVSTVYELTGIVVHSGQASGGHYYSYISSTNDIGNDEKSDNSNTNTNTKNVRKWYKFDDGEVTECRMDDEEELKNQCFGGDYSGEVFDHMMRRMSFRRQKRWWNAYILFYTRKDPNEEAEQVKMESSISPIPGPAKFGLKNLPSDVGEVVQKQNIDFMHTKAQFSAECFQFIRKLAGVNCHVVQRLYEQELPFAETDIMKNKLIFQIDYLSLHSIKLATFFLFSIGFRAKKNLRCASTKHNEDVDFDWADIFTVCLKSSRLARLWFAKNGVHLFTHPINSIYKNSPCVDFMESTMLSSSNAATTRIGEYLLDCPSVDVRSTFGKTLISLVKYSLDDYPEVSQSTPLESEGNENPLKLMMKTTPRYKPIWQLVIESILNLLRRGDVVLADSNNGRHHLRQYFEFFLNFASVGDEQRTMLFQQLSAFEKFEKFFQMMNSSLSTTSNNSSNFLMQNERASTMIETPASKIYERGLELAMHFHSYMNMIERETKENSKKMKQMQNQQQQYEGHSVSSSNDPVVMGTSSPYDEFINRFCEAKEKVEIESGELKAEDTTTTTETEGGEKEKVEGQGQEWIISSKLKDLQFE